MKELYKDKYNSTARDHIDIFLEDNFIEKLFHFMEKQNLLLIVKFRIF